MAKTQLDAAAGGKAELWKPWKPPTVRIRAEETRTWVESDLEELVHWTADDRKKQRVECDVRQYIQHASGFRTPGRIALRATFIEALNRPDISSKALSDHVKGSCPVEIWPTSFDIGDHRQQRCSCFRDPALEPAPDRLDQIEEKLADLRTQVDRLVIFAQTAWAGASVVVNPRDQEEDQ